MRREHAKHSGELTRYALSQGFSKSVTRKDGSTVLLSRAGGRGSPFIVCVTDKRGSHLLEYKELGEARNAFNKLIGAHD